MGKTVSKFTEDIIEKKAEYCDLIINQLLDKHLLPRTPEMLEQVGYKLVTETKDNVTSFLLCKIVDKHTLTEDFDADAAKFTLTIDKVEKL